MRKFAPEVKATYDSMPPNIRKPLLAIRDLIHSTARKTPGVGAIEETLKWGEPAYLTSETKSGTTLRLGFRKSDPTQFAVYVNCQSSLVDSFRAYYPELRYEGNRAVVFKVGEELPVDTLAHIIQMALTYHHAKRNARHVNQR